VMDLNHLYRAEPALFDLDFDPAGFQWIDCNDHLNSVVSFMRRARDRHNVLIVVLNFTPVVRADYVVGVPEPGGYRELINTDSEIYGGSNKGNAGAVFSQPVPAHGHAHRLQLLLPPLSCLILKKNS